MIDIIALYRGEKPYYDVKHDVDPIEGKSLIGYIYRVIYSN